VKREAAYGPAFDGDGELLDLGDGEARRLAEGLDDVLRVHTVLHERLALAQELASQDYHRGGAVANLRRR